MKINRFVALLLAVAVLLSLPALAINVSGENTISDGQATSIITIAAEPAQMTVTVPAVLPISVAADGTVSVASDALVTNLSKGPVYVTDIMVQSAEQWSLVGSDYNFSSAKVNSKVVQVSVNEQVADKDSGQVPMPTGSWNIPGLSSYNFTYSAKIPAQEYGFTGDLASIVFTVDWDKIPEVPLTGLKITGPSSVAKGSTIALTATKVPDNTTNIEAITWSSSNSSIATVDNDGVVTGVSAGTVTITAKCGDKVVGHTVVTTVPINGLSISGADTVIKNNTITLTATKTPPDATGSITWSSSNTSIASVNSSGVVTGKAGGSVTITATCNGKSATHAVKVVVPPDSVSGATLDVHEGGGYNTMIMHPEYSFGSQNIERVSTNTYSAIFAIDVSESHNHEHSFIFAIPPIDGWAIANVQGVINGGGTTYQISFNDYTNNGACKAYKGIMYYGMGWPVFNTSSTNSITITFTLKPSDDIYLRSLNLTGPDTVSVGNTIQLSAAKVPSNTTDTGVITWSSSDTSVATVSSTGVVTGKAGGTATITASCNGVTASKSVTAKEPLNLPSSIMVSISGEYMSGDGSSSGTISFGNCYLWLNDDNETYSGSFTIPSSRSYDFYFTIQMPSSVSNLITNNTALIITGTNGYCGSYTVTKGSNWSSGMIRLEDSVSDFTVSLVSLGQ